MTDDSKQALAELIRMKEQAKQIVIEYENLVKLLQELIEAKDREVERKGGQDVS